MNNYYNSIEQSFRNDGYADATITEVMLGQGRRPGENKYRLITDVKEPEYRVPADRIRIPDDRFPKGRDVEYPHVGENVVVKVRSLYYNTKYQKNGDNSYRPGVICREHIDRGDAKNDFRVNRSYDIIYDDGKEGVSYYSGEQILKVDDKVLVNMHEIDGTHYCNDNGEYITEHVFHMLPYTQN
jgi:hypothetical protein